MFDSFAQFGHEFASFLTIGTILTVL